MLSCEIKLNQKFTPQEFIKRLISLGYQENVWADQPGVFARRGGIVDVFPSVGTGLDLSLQTCRFEFDEKKLVQIKEIESGRLHKQLKLFSNSAVQTLQKKKLDISFILNLNPNDFVVHIDHGIAKFKKMVKQEAASILREYFVLEYAKKDKLYLPIDQADKIDKYLGKARPKLQRLDTASWHKICEKTKEDVIKQARELLNIYAERQLAKTKIIQEDLSQEQALVQSFLYEETPDQARTLQEIYFDLSQDKPMDRLVCGDVGFGKTEVAVRTAFRVVRNKAQAALLCPTTILAQQHFDTFCHRLKKFPIKVGLLNRLVSLRSQKQTIEKLSSGELDIVIGTHRILSADVEFKNLGLIIIDEEQRFGVKHKEKLKALRAQAHILTLTATPIPRTLHFSLSGLRDISLIQTAPEGRLAVKTQVVPYNKNLVKQAVESELNRQGQVYYLFNKVEAMSLKLRQLKRLLPKIRFGVMHGQLKKQEIARTMHLFDTGRIDVLICSTIIENGLDLPNVNTLIVENSVKFGLAQLHQIRGRIGRGARQAYAYFLFKRLKNQDQDQSLKSKERERLQALEKAAYLGAGFDLAMKDLEIRGVGHLLGKKQHGGVGAIGLSLYLQLLNQAVEEIKTSRRDRSKPVPTIRDVSIDLPLEYSISPELEPLAQKRMKIYQDLAKIRSLEELAEYQNRLNKNFVQQNDNRNDQLENLFKIFKIKILAQYAGISSIEIINLGSRKRLLLRFYEEDYQAKLPQLLDTNPNWHIGEDSIKIDLADLGKTWIKELEKVLRFFIKQ